MRIYHADTSPLAKVCGSWLTDESCTLGQHLAPGVVGTSRAAYQSNLD